jgi:hypothetical protein
MTPLLTLTGLLLAVASDPTDTHLRQVREELAFPHTASYWVEYDTRYDALEEDQVRAAQRHFEVAREACTIQTGVINGVVLRRRAAGKVPPCIMNAEPDKRIRTSERLDVAWPWFRQQTRGQEGHDLADWTEWRVWDPSGLTVWNTSAGRTGPAQRLTLPEVWDAEYGAVMLFGRHFRQIGVLLEQASKERLVQAHDNGFSVSISMLDLELLDQFKDMYLPNGVMTTPGYAELEYDNYGARRQLSVRYRDCLDQVCVGVSLRWTGDEPFPTQLEERWFAPGADCTYRVQVVNTARIEEAAPTAESLSWIGEVGQEVHDRRFGTFQSYTAGPERPSDAMLALQAESRNKQTTRVPHTLAKLELIEGARHWRIVSHDLPSHAPASVTRRARVVLENFSDSMLSMEPPTATCGVISLGFDHRTILGQQEGELAVEFELNGSETESIEIAFPYYAQPYTERLQLKLRFAVKGVESALTPTLQGPFRWVEGEPLPAVNCELNADTSNGLTLDVSARPPTARWAVVPDGNRTRLELSDMPSSNVFGAIVAEVQVRDSIDSGEVSCGTVLLDRVPKAFAECWPSTVLTTCGGFPRRTEFHLPSVPIRGAELIQDGGVSLGRTLVQLSWDDDRLTIVEPQPSGTPTALAHYRLRVESDLGEVHLLVYSAPATN